MSYIINKTDGSVLTEVVDGTIDQTTTDITLVGKNSTSYGELFNENFVKILENFATVELVQVNNSGGSLTTGDKMYLVRQRVAINSYTGFSLVSNPVEIFSDSPHFH